MINYIQMNIVLHSSFSSIMSSLEIYQTFCRKGPQPHPDLIVWTPVISSPALLRTVLFRVSHCCLWGCLLRSAEPPPSSARTPHTGLCPGRPCIGLALRGRKERRETAWELEWRCSGEWGVSGRDHALENCERGCLGRKASWSGCRK